MHIHYILAELPNEFFAKSRLSFSLGEDGDETSLSTRPFNDKHVQNSDFNFQTRYIHHCFYTFELRKFLLKSASKILPV